MKHQIVHTLQKYFLNLPIKIALAIGLPLPGYALVGIWFPFTGAGVY